MELGAALTASYCVRENSACSCSVSQAPKKSTTSSLGWDDVAAGSGEMQLCLFFSARIACIGVFPHWNCAPEVIKLLQGRSGELEEMAEFEKTVCPCSKLLLRVLFGQAWELPVLKLLFFSCVVSFQKVLCCSFLSSCHRFLSKKK